MDLFVFTLLFTTFCVLIAALYIGKYLPVLTGRRSLERNHELFFKWFDDHCYRLPSEHEILSLINEQSKHIKPVKGGEQWSNLNINRLLEGTKLPSFCINKVTKIQQDKLCCQVLIEWPDCIPGLQVSVDLNGEIIVCHLQIDWIILQGELNVVPIEKGGVSLSWRQTTPLTSAISCLVVSPEKWKANMDIMKPLMVAEDRETEASENLASSVTEGVISLLEQFEFDNVSLPLHKQEEEEEEEEEKEEEKEEEEEEEEEELIQEDDNKDKGLLVVEEEEEKEDDTNNKVFDDDSAQQEQEQKTLRNIITVTSHPLIHSDNAILTTNNNTSATITTPTINEPITASEIKSEPPAVHRKTPPTQRKTPPMRIDAAPPPPSPPITKDHSLGNGVVHSKLQWLGELPVISEPGGGVEEDEEEEEKEERKVTSPLKRMESPSTWRRSDSYENLKDDIMPQLSPVLPYSSTPPTSRQFLRTYPSTPPPPRPLSVQSNTPVSLKIAQSEEDLLNENDEQRRKRRRQMTLSVRSYDTDTPVATGRLPSMLVFELEEGTQRRHIVALNTFHATKLRKQLTSYTKLHIYNDHTFTATHIKGKQLCGVCNDKVAGLFGKQCYICRDCSLIVHKECHFKVELPCPKSKVSKMCLIDPDRLSSISKF